MPDSPERPPEAAAVSVVIVAYDSGPHLARCLAALSAQTFTGFEAIVWDNASRDDAFRQARASNTDPRFQFVEGGGNLGFAAGNNRAVEGATAPWIAFLNPDAFPEPGWLARLMGAAARHPEVDAFASLQVDAGAADRLDGAGDALSVLGLPWRGGHGGVLRPVPAGEVFSPCGAAALIRADRFRALGGFAEAFFCFCEDVDLGFRLRLAGGTCRLVPDAVVAHVGGASTGRRSAFAVYHGARNRLWMLVRCMPGLLFWPLLPFHLAATGLLFLQAATGGLGSAFARGWWDGVLAMPRVWRERRAIQAGRRAPTAAIARALCWSPVKLITRAPDIF